MTFNFFGTYHSNLSSAGNINQGLLLISGGYENRPDCLQQSRSLWFWNSQDLTLWVRANQRATSPPLLPQLGMFLWVNFYIWHIHGVYTMWQVLFESFININSLIRHCISYVTNYPKMYQLKTINIYYLIVSMGQDLGEKLRWMVLAQGLSQRSNYWSGLPSSGARGSTSRFTRVVLGRSQFLPKGASLQTDWVFSLHGIWLP